MDKPLSNIDKKGDGAHDEVKNAPPADSTPMSRPDSAETKPKPGHHDYIAENKPDSRSILGNEIPAPDRNQSYNPEISEQKWKDSKINQRWDASPLGRAAIRVGSRGGLGAMAFAAGGWYAGKSMKGYNYEQGMAFADMESPNALKYVARSIDSFVGRPITGIAKLLGAGEEAAHDLTRFRPTKNLKIGSKGRSLGHEVVMISTDFSAASVADAFGRDLANLADPNVKHSWKDKDGNIDYKEAAKATAKTAWRYVSYNGGEDWGVAIPYAYYMKAQRHLINKASPGFALDFDRGLNGGSKKVNKESQITGNYNIPGIMDLQGRFTVYNIGTLMYREGYNYIDDKIHGRNARLYGSPNDPNHKEHHGILGGLGEIAKWTARSTVKGAIYMTPAVPFFSVFRTSQSKYKGLFINPDDETALGYKNNNTTGSKYDALHADELRHGHGFDLGMNVEFRKMDKSGTGFHSVSPPVNHPLSAGYFNAYGQKEGNSFLNSIGKTQNNFRAFAREVPAKYGFKSPTPVSVDNYVNAAFAYTPYMYAKGETARLWDDGKMDASSERMIDGAANLDWSEFKAGAGEVWRSILRKPLAEPAREAYAQKRIDEDSSPADMLTNEQATIRALEERYVPSSSWRNRVIHGNPPEKEKPEKQSSYAEQEVLRKALSELQPPTNSIH